jgi:hypothetical protein
MLTQGVLGSRQLWLSSGVQPADGANDSDSAASGEILGSVLVIKPPFRLDVAAAAGAPKQNLVEAGSDAGFRAVTMHLKEGLTFV